MSQTEAMVLNDNNVTYNQHASTYADVSKQSPPWLYFDKPALDTLLGDSVRKDTRVLELGCGSGKVIDYLCEKGVSEANVTGIDSSSELIGIAQKNHPQADFVVQDISLMDAHEGIYDLILAVRVFEYLSLETLQTVLQKCNTSLKPDGALIMIVGHPIRVNGPDIATYQARGPRSHTVPGGIPVELMHKTVSDYINALTQANLTINHVDETAPSDALQQASPADYERYLSYGAVTLVVKATKQ